MGEEEAQTRRLSSALVLVASLLMPITASFPGFVSGSYNNVNRPARRVRAYKLALGQQPTLGIANFGSSASSHLVPTLFSIRGGSSTTATAARSGPKTSKTKPESCLNSSASSSTLSTTDAAAAMETSSRHTHTSTQNSIQQTVAAPHSDQPSDFHRNADVTIQTPASNTNIWRAGSSDDQGQEEELDMPSKALIEEPICSPSAGRRNLFPLQHSDLWSMYKQHIASFWTSDEIDLSQDIDDWQNKLNDNERHFLSMVLAFFAGADGIVMENLAERFCREITLPEARSFYSFQMAMESIHQETYCLLIEAYISDPHERHRLFDAEQDIPSVRAKAKWATQYIGSSASFAERLVAFAAVEGIFFSGSFCAIFWLKKRALMPGLTFSNELISRDEGLHCQFACQLYSKLQPSSRLPEADIHQIISNAVTVEKGFVCDALPVSLIGMNSELMAQYIEFVADRLLKDLGYRPYYGSTNPFDCEYLFALSMPYRSIIFCICRPFSAFLVSQRLIFVFLLSNILQGWI
jgi:ribonucleotide reductase beta subunit family protein with ferritin-like domain